MLTSSTSPSPAGCSAPRCSSGAASPSASDAIAAGRPARSDGREIGRRERRVEVGLAHARGRRPCPVSETSGPRIAPRCSRSTAAASAASGSRTVAAARAREADLLQHPRRAERAQLVVAVEPVDGRRGVEHQRRGRRRVAARVLARDLRAVGDAEQRQLVDAERAPQVLEVLGGLGRVPEGALVAELGRARRDVVRAVERAVDRARVARPALVDRDDVIARAQRLAAGPRPASSSGIADLTRPAAEQDDRAGPRAGRRHLGVGQRERPGGRAGMVERDGQRARTAHPSDRRRKRRTGSAREPRCRGWRARRHGTTGLRTIRTPESGGRGRWSMSPNQAHFMHAWSRRARVAAVRAPV